MLAETGDSDRFSELCNDSLSVEEHWRIRPTQETCSVIAERDCQPRLIVLAGRQIVTSERLEVLALGTREHIADGMPLDDTIQRALAADALVVLPWGFGKWWFRRGKVVRRALRSFSKCGIYLGDNGGRPQHCKTPRLLREAERDGVLTLPGSDALPFPSEIGRVGSYGFVLSGDIDLSFPARCIKQLIRQLGRQPKPFGRRVTWPAFCRNQVLAQLRKHNIC